MNETSYLSWRQLLRRVRPGRCYHISYFGEPRLHWRGEADGILELFGLSVKSLAEEAIAGRCAETGVEDRGVAAEAEWAVRRTVSRTLTGEEAEDQTMRQLLVLARVGRRRSSTGPAVWRESDRQGWAWSSMPGTGTFGRSTSWE